VFELGQPAFKGQFCIDKPSNLSTGALFLAAQRKTWGDKKWFSGICRRVTTSLGPQPREPSLFVVDNCDIAAAIPLVGTRRVVPGFFTQRNELPLCGYMLSPLETEPRAMDCFRAAVASGAPAEFVLTASRSDSGQVAQWFRVLRQGTFEVLTNTLSRAGASTTSSWIKQSCTRLDVPADNTPPLAITTIDCQVVN